MPISVPASNASSYAARAPAGQSSGKIDTIRPSLVAGEDGPGRIDDDRAGDPDIAEGVGDESQVARIMFASILGIGDECVEPPFPSLIRGLPFWRNGNAWDVDSDHTGSKAVLRGGSSISVTAFRRWVRMRSAGEQPPASAMPTSCRPPALARSEHR